MGFEWVTMGFEMGFERVEMGFARKETLEISCQEVGFEKEVQKLAFWKG